jgi:hypothetical protein
MRELIPRSASRQINNSKSTTDIDVDMHAPAVVTELLDDNPERHGYLTPAAKAVDFTLSPPDAVADDNSESYFAERFLIDEYTNGFVG